MIKKGEKNDLKKEKNKRKGRKNREKEEKGEKKLVTIATAGIKRVKIQCSCVRRYSK